ncbi:hypothetical protein NESM_000711500 [Novymonas esmeraldas]|uniref:Uncharacterized protein n=1 Tax=Novymonas esmeraldas TaxID=1808958 RepID=A0AAW0EXL1_9TRYP
MRRHRPLRDAHQTLVDGGIEEGHGDPHLSCSPISITSVHRSRAVDTSSADASATAPPPPPPPPAFYDGPTLRNSIPALLARLTQAPVTSPPRTLASASAASAEADARRQRATSVLVHPIVVPPCSGRRHTPPTAAEPRGAGVQSTAVAAARLHTHFRREKPQETATTSSGTRAADQVARWQGEAAEHTSHTRRPAHVVSRPARYVVVQRPAAAHVVTPESPERGRSSQPYRSVASHTSSSSSNERVHEVRSISAASSRQDAGSRCRAPRVKERRDQLNNAAAPVATRSNSAATALDTVASSARERFADGSEVAAGARCTRAARSSTLSSHAGHGTSPPRLGGLFEAVLSNRTGSYRTRAASPPPLSAAGSHQRTLRHASDVTSPSAPPPREWEGRVAVAEAGDPLVLRRTLDYLLAKAQRLELENQRLWRQTHSWDPHRALVPHSVAVSSLNVATPHPRRPHTREPRVFVQRQLRSSQERSRSDSATLTSTTRQQDADPKRSGGGVGEARSPSSHAAREDVPIAETPRSTKTAARSSILRVDAVAQWSPPSSEAAIDSPRAAEAVASAAAAPQHAQAGVQTDSASLVREAAHERRRSSQHEMHSLELRDGRDATAATPLASTVRSRRSLDSQRSIGVGTAQARPSSLLPVPDQPPPRSQSRCSADPLHGAGASVTYASSALPGRPPTHSKQVQTASIWSPPVDEATTTAAVEDGGGGGDALMGSPTDGTASALSTERTAVIELHTSDAYTRHTVRRLRAYCSSLESTRQQLRRRLSASTLSSPRTSVAALSRVQSPSSRSNSHHHLHHPQRQQQQQPSPLQPTAAAVLSRPFFTSEYADPEVDATMHDVGETAAVETMIVLHDDGAGTVTKRMVDSSPSRPSSSMARSSSPQWHQQRVEAAAAAAAAASTTTAHRHYTAVADIAASSAHRNSPQHLPPQHLRNTHVTEVVTEEPLSRPFNMSLRSDGSGPYRVPVVQLGRPVRSASPHSWNVLGRAPAASSPEAVPLAPFLVEPPSGESPSLDRLSAPPTTPSDTGDAKRLSAAAAPVLAAPVRSTSTSSPPPPPPVRSSSHRAETAVSVSVSLSGHTAAGTFAGQPPGIPTTSTTTRASSSVYSQRFAVREASVSALPAEQRVRSLSKSSSRSSGGSDPAGAAAHSLAALWNPAQRLPHSPSRQGSPAAAPSVSSRVGGAAASSPRLMPPVDTSTLPDHPDTRPLPLSTAAAPEQHVLSPVRHPSLDSHDTVHGGSGDRSGVKAGSGPASAAASPAPSAPRGRDRLDIVRIERSATAAFASDEAEQQQQQQQQQHDTTPSLAAQTRLTPMAPLTAVEHDVVSPDGADSFHSSEAADSPRSSRSAEEVVQAPSSSSSPPLPLQQHIASRILVSPSPPRQAAAEEVVQDADTHRVGSSRSGSVAASATPRRRLSQLQHRPPVAPARVIVMTKDADDDGDDGNVASSASHSSSVPSRSLHSFVSTPFSSDGDSDGEAEDEDGQVRYSQWF